jgi:hypothetical protein
LFVNFVLNVTTAYWLSGASWRAACPCGWEGDTNGDAVVWLPQQKVLATGDVVVWPYPFGAASYPQSRIDMLRGIENAQGFSFPAAGNLFDALASNV